MKKQSKYAAIAVFALAAAAAIFAVFFWQRKKIADRGNQNATKKNFSQSERLDGAPYDADLSQAQIALLPSETLVSAQSFDLNGDSFEDEICVVQNESGEMSIVIGIYNMENGNFDRAASFDTFIADSQSLEVSFVDLIGDHSSCAVVTGTKSSGKTALLAVCVENAPSPSVRQIAEIECDGAISVQKTERSPSYSRYMSKGESFSIVAVDGAGANSQTSYNWNPVLERYQKAFETALPEVRSEGAKKIGALPLQERISLLDGLWYLTSSTESQSRCIFFDSAGGEVSFAYSDGQEVFLQKSESARRNGVSFLIQNSVVSTLKRRCDVTFVSEDEIQVKVSDDVRMPISDDALWTGAYRRQRRFGAEDAEKSGLEKIKNFVRQIDGKTWSSSDGKSLFVKGGRFSLSDNGALTEGEAAFRKEDENFCVQFRTGKRNSLLDGQFIAEIGRDEKGEFLVLTPASQTSAGTAPTGKTAMTFTKG